MDYLGFFGLGLSVGLVGLVLHLRRTAVDVDKTVDRTAEQHRRAFMAGLATRLARDHTTASAEIFRSLRESRTTQGPMAAPTFAEAPPPPVEGLTFEGSIDDFSLSGGTSSEIRV